MNCIIFCSSLAELTVSMLYDMTSSCFLCCSDEELPVVTPASIDPTLLRRYNELFDAVMRARRDKKKKYVLFFSPLYLFFFVFNFCKVHVSYYLFCCAFSYIPEGI